MKFVPKQNYDGLYDHRALLVIVVIVVLLLLLLQDFFLRKSNAHTLILDWCAFALDGVKNVTNEQTNERTRGFKE